MEALADIVRANIDDGNQIIKKLQKQAEETALVVSHTGNICAVVMVAAAFYIDDSDRQCSVVI